ncbi:hypothetical protein GDO86_013437 [Hymenochirus boettgeri]|uniref:Clarin 3 n=1 Tax=Hymenochirus boettgeri TaxID=247094 RepID=A0A8T2IRB9_9PIPI|nr:hypothetical protein GDO86_013437 [Hymenochirus boettgeri]
MPSKQKTLLFLSGFVASIGSFAVICACLGTTEWVSSEVAFKNGNSTGFVTVEYGLFKGTSVRIVTNGIEALPVHFQVADILKDNAKTIHVFVILFLVLGLLCSFVTSAITCLNSVSNPYLTFLGPIGVYTWASINAFLVLLVLSLCAANTEITGVPKLIAISLDEFNDEFNKSQQTYGYSFWLLLLSMFLNIATIIVIYIYHHARYSERREQERPLEKASQDVILF